MVDPMTSCPRISGTAFLIALLLIVFFAASAYAAVAIGPSASAIRNITAIGTPGITVANNTTSSGGSLSNIPALSSASVLTITPAITEALKRGPMVYAGTSSKVLVIDSSDFNVISTIKPDVDKAVVNGVAVSPDGQYVYMAYSWEVYQDDYYGGHYDHFGRVVRLNATTQQPIDYYEFDNIYPEHLAVSPDGRVYLGYQVAYSESYGGYKIMDFQQGKSWGKEYTIAEMMYDFAFSPDGGNVYYTGWYNPNALYDLDWSQNLIHYYNIPGNSSTDYEYPRSVAVAKGGQMVYAAIKENKGIFAMNTQDHGKQVIPTDYYPTALAASPDGETLIALGYFLDQDNNPIYVVHKYGALKTVGPFYTDLLNYMIFSKDSFYTYDSTSYITSPAGSHPSNIALTSDGRFAYVSTLHDDSVSGTTGTGIIVYDLGSYMYQVKIIDEKDSIFDITASSSKILFSPPPDYSWLQQAVGFPSSVLNIPFPLVPTSFHPDNGTFASHYKEDFFSVYATFSDYLDNKTVNGSTFWVTEKSGALVSGKVTAASKLAIFLPDSQLKPDTDYVAHLSKAIASKSGKSLGADVEWVFTTRSTTNQSTVPIAILLNLTQVKRIAPLAQLNFSVAPEANNSASGNQTQPAQQNQTQAQNQTQVQNMSQGPQYPPAQQQPGQPQGGTGQQPGPQNASQPLSNGSANGTNPQPGQPTPNGTQPAPNVTQPPANPLPATAPQSPQPSGGTDIISGIINFFKSLFEWK